MPATSAKQYGLMQAVAHGTAKKKPKGLSKREAREFVMKTKPKKRSRFAKTLARKRKSLS
ncbi:hypothetical protein LCGC14_2284480 [marine sediment metagenome]|uniref:Uncharacterized protein n=1 Tax=marine sediment metagenome TaxID=412755 RepID=A0A0F9DFJ3_9ZZZZ